MPIAARILQRVEARVALFGGALILVVAILILSKLSPQTGEAQLFWPLVIRSFGQVLMFLPLSLATLGPIPKQDIAAATGFYSLTRQLGGSIGVALLTTMLDQRQAFHRNVLIEHLSASDPHVMERINMLTGAFAAKGLSLENARQNALLVLDRSVSVQAMVMSFADTFVATAMLIAVFLPLVFLLGKPSKGAPAPSGDAH
jgi:DHA2 family multidrug resistance protein